VKRPTPWRTVAIAFAIAAMFAADPRAGGVDSGTVRLRPAEPSESALPSADAAPVPIAVDAPRGFDYDAFEARLLGLWFQRKVYLSQGRDEDVQRQSDAIRAFCRSEGIGRLPGLADALLVEARQSLDQGHYRRVDDALALAEDLDPGRAQIRFARAEATWSSGRGMLRAAGEFLAGVRFALVEEVEDFSLVNEFAPAAVVAAMGAVLLFSLLMLGRYHVAFRHEVEEWSVGHGRGAWGAILGWLVLLSPLIVWIGAGWVALFWIAVMFRFMRRSERLAGVVLVALTIAAVPAFRVAVGVFGLTSDPVVRTTLDAARSPYHPDRIVRLRDLVESHPEDPTLRFLLAGLYQSGRFYDEAFREYRRALDVDPGMYQAYINIGNLYHRTGQYNEAIANYLRALELRPDSVLAYYDMYLAQSESFQFREATASLERARAADPDRLSELMSGGASDGSPRPGVVDATVDLGSVWSAALEGGPVDHRLGEAEAAPERAFASLPAQFLNPITFVALAALVTGAVLTGAGKPHPPARRCIRCGRPFCHRCKSGREGHEYCTQCMHLFVLGDGLAPETKNRKLFEVERHERRTRLGRKIAGVLVPGAAQVLRGRVGRGLLLATIWFAALVASRPALFAPVERALGLDLRLDLLRAGDVPVGFAIDPLSLVGLAVAAVVWLTANASILRRREV